MAVVVCIGLYGFSSPYLGIVYDAGGLRGYLFWLTVLLGFPFVLPNEMLFALNDGHRFPFQKVISVAITFSSCAGLDFLLRRYVMKPRRDGTTSGDKA